MICTKCKIDKVEEEFSFKSGKTERRTQCKKCHSEYRKQKYIENKEKEISQVLEYRKLNPNKYTKEYKKINYKHSSFSKKAGRIYESKCPICNNIVYVTLKELEINFIRYCSIECRSNTFKDEYEHYCSNINKRIKGCGNNNVTPEYLKLLMEKQENKCAITNLPIRVYSNKEKNTLYESASLDRIDSKIGYIEGNVQWVCLGINYMKLNFSNEELIKTIELIKQA
jgi:hypothetical protein